MKVIIINDLANGLKAGLIDLPSDVAEALIRNGIAELPQTVQDAKPEAVKKATKK